MTEQQWRNLSFIHSQALATVNFPNPLPCGRGVLLIVGSDGLGYMVVQETKWYISTMSGEWLQRLWSYIQYRSRCQEDVSTTCLYPFLRHGSRRVGAGGSGVGSDLWP